MTSDDSFPFVQFGPQVPESPVVLSVAHAGRSYPERLKQLCRYSEQELMPLEDRHADRLVDLAARDGCSGLCATVPRAWIDLNRAETDIDPDMFVPSTRKGTVSARARGGLGLIPRRVAGLGDIWRSALLTADLADRIAKDHRPYHDALSGMLARARGRFGVAVLVDIHSMPTLANAAHHRQVDVVLGDRFGASADHSVTACILNIGATLGYHMIRNVPYSGGYITERHGAPGRGIHAVQLEFDRRLYLDTAGQHVTPGLSKLQNLVAHLTHAIAAQVLPASLREAAE
jgi:N-formylglutamate amidohydrolase